MILLSDMPSTPLGNQEEMITFQNSMTPTGSAGRLWTLCGAIHSCWFSPALHHRFLSRALILFESVQAFTSAFVSKTVICGTCINTISTELLQLSKYQNVWPKSLTGDISVLMYLPHFYASNLGQILVDNWVVWFYGLLC